MSATSHSQTGASPNSTEQALAARVNDATQALIAGQLDDALRLFNDVIATNALAPRLLAASHYHRGIIHQKNGRFNDAAADYTTALWLEELPDNMRARAHYNRGTALDNLGQQERAKQDFDLAISLMPDMSAAYNNRANVLRRMGQLEAAIADYDKSIELGNPLPHLPHFGRASAKQALGDVDGARADLKRAIALAPDYAPAAAALAALPTQPSALQVAATPRAVESKVAKPVASVDETTVQPVETALLPPPPSQTASAPQPIEVIPKISALPQQSASAVSAVAPRAAAVPQGMNEARRITTASAAPTQPDADIGAGAGAAPMPMMGTWTTTILPAGSRDVLTLDDASPALTVPTTSETQLAAATVSARASSPVRVSAGQSGAQPQTGLSFPGISADAYREAVRPVTAGVAVSAPATAVPSAARTYADYAGIEAAPRAASGQPIPQATAQGGFGVQLASFRSEAEAQAAWTDIAGRYSTALQNRDHMVQRAQVPGKGTYFRLRVGPMAARSSAAALCSTLKAQGQDCYVTKL